jgi:hypothetical protein
MSARAIPTRRRMPPDSSIGHFVDRILQDSQIEAYVELPVRLLLQGHLVREGR